MRNRIFFLCLFFTFLFASFASHSQVQTPRYVSMTGSSGGYYEYLPQGYNNGSQSYPLIVFIHGIGEKGNGNSDLPNLLNCWTALPRLIQNGAFPATFTSGGQSFSFIVISPQFKWWPSASDVNDVVNYAAQNYRVDPSRIYVTGLSMGGGAVWDFAGAYPTNATAIVPICGASYPSQTKAQAIASAKLPVWATQNQNDWTVPSFYTPTWVSYLQQDSGIVVSTIFPVSGHDAWTTTYDPNFRQNNLNIYEWMLQYKKGASTPPVPPVASAGANQTITLPLNTVTLNGSGSSSTGSISSYLWSQVSGPSGSSFTSASSASTRVNNLVQGIYVFRLTVTDNGGLTATSDVTVTVNAAPVPPVAGAGANQTITLPLNTVTLNGSGSSSTGSISSYLWSQVSGPSGSSFTSASSASTRVNNLVQGIYVFRLTVTDNGGLTATSDVTVTVNAAPVPPVAGAGANQTITLPLNTVTLNGSGSSSTGSISSYLWSQVSGPSGSSFTSASSASTRVNNLVQGIYVFRLTVTDNGGLTATSDVTVTVNAAPVPPVAGAGANQTITLPLNTVTLNGSGSSSTGSISSYLWSQVSGPSGSSFTSASSASTRVNNLVQGIYVFRLTVTDNGGLTATSDVTVTVNAAPVPPVAGAGANQTITLPLNTVTLNGSGSSSTGSISSYLWSQVSGPSGSSFTSASSASTRVNNLVQGIYVFRLTVTDNGGLTATSDVTVTVNAAPVPPVAGAGANQTITLPLNTVTLNGSGSSSTGSISSYLWSQVSGPSGSSFTSASSASTRVNNLVQGIYVFRLTVTDNGGLTATSDVTVTVNAAPVPPVAGAGANQTITLPLNTVTLNGSGSSSTGSISSYLWSQVSGPSGSSFTSASSASTRVNNLVQGIYVFRLTVTDNGGLTATSDVTVTVNAAPVPPVAGAGANQTITLPLNTVTLNGSGSSSTGSISSYLWSQVSGPSGSSFTSASSASTRVNNLVQGIYVFRLTVTDNGGLTATSDVTVTVNAAPVPPVAGAGANQTITLPLNTVTLNGSGSSSTGSISSYLWSQVSGPSGSSFTSASSASTRVNNLVQGIYVFRLTVTDNGGLTATSDVTVTVNAAPVPPVAGAGANQTITLPLNTVTLNGSGSSSTGSISSYLWSQVSGPSGSSFTSASSASTRVNNLVQGIYVFRLTVTDNGGLTATSDVTVTVNAAPVPPVAGAGANQTITLPLNTVTLNGSGSSSTGSISSYLWSQVSGPSGSSFTSASSASTRVNNLVQGIYVFRLTVTDNGGLTATSDVTVTVNAAPVPPVAGAGANQTITLPLNTVTLNGSGSSSTGSISSYLWSQVSGPSGSSFSSASSASTRVNNLVQGIYVFRLTVTDNGGLTATSDVTVTVNAAPVPPVASAGANQTITLPLDSVILNGSGMATNGTVVKYNWSIVDGPSGFQINSPDHSQTTVLNLVEGTYRFRLTVWDNRNASSNDIVVVKVLPNQAKISTATLYPVPATSMLNLKINALTSKCNSTILIFNSLGSIVYSERFLRTEAQLTKQLDVSKFEPGFYVLSVTTDINTNANLQFIKQ